jgi:hypothetical protein
MRVGRVCPEKRGGELLWAFGAQGDFELTNHQSQVAIDRRE